MTDQPTRTGFRKSLFHPIDVFVLRVDNYVANYLSSTRGLGVFTGIVLGYATIGLWLAWESWHTRSVLALVVGISQAIIGVVFATILIVKLNLDKRISAFTAIALNEHRETDVDLFEQSDEVIEAYLEKAVQHLQQNGFIPFYDGASEEVAYEQIIEDSAKYIYAESLDK